MKLIANSKAQVVKVNEKGDIDIRDCLSLISFG